LLVKQLFSTCRLDPMKLTVRLSLLLIAAFLCFQSCQKESLHVAPLAITALSTTSGSYNASVTLTGTGFSIIRTDNQVFFNGKPALILSASETAITVAVPMGAGIGPVSVSVNEGPLVMGPVFNYQGTAVVSTVAGGSTAGLSNGPALSATFTQLWGIAADNKGNIFTTEYIQSGLIRELSQGTVSLFAGNTKANGYQDGTGTAAGFNRPWGMAIDAANNLYVAEATRIRKVTPDAVVTSINIPGAVNISSVAVDAAGNIFTADQQLNKIFKTTPAGATTVFAGSGNSASIDGTGTAASFRNLMGMTIDKSDNLYVVDLGSSAVRKITPAAVVRTIAGNGLPGSADGLSTAASFNLPIGIAIDAQGNLYVADTFNNKIRKIATDGTVTTVAGQGAQESGSVDGPAKTATFNHPTGVAIDGSGNIYVTEYSDVRKISFQ